MDRRTRICLWVIMLGLANFAAYVIGWLFIGGDAMNGYVSDKIGPAAGWSYTLGHTGEFVSVSRGVWIYSALHSISIWLTMGAVMLAMLTLAKDRIVSAMRRAVVRGRTVMTILATLITAIVIIMTVWFVLHTVRQLSPAPSHEPISPVVVR